jgi:hypothetical protein
MTLYLGFVILMPFAWTGYVILVSTLLFFVTEYVIHGEYDHNLDDDAAFGIILNFISIIATCIWTLIDEPKYVLV